MKSNLNNGRPAEVLLVEDNLDDVELTRIAFEHSRFAVNLHHVENGVECMDFLRKSGRFADLPRPDLVLLDLNMPVMNGHEVLVRMVADPSLRSIPVIILTTSTGDADILAAYDLRCSSYIVKPVDFESFSEAIRKLSEYWFTLVVLPKKGADD